MLSSIPIMLAKLKKEDCDKEILRAAMIAELDAINLYEQMAALAKDKRIRKVLLEVDREEKTHRANFKASF